jgi:flagellar hook-associated protein 2
MGPGALWISVGGKGFLVNVNPQDMTIAGVRDAINTSKGNKGSKGVTASVVYGTDGARLVLRANEAGADREVKVQALALPGSGLATLDSRRMTTMAKGQEAQATVDGVQVKSRTNSITNAIPGVSLSIGGPGKATVKVTSNAEGAKKSLQDFATAYNAYLGTINQLQAGVLKDDMSLQDTRNAVITSLTTPAPAQTTLTKLPGQVANAVGKVPVVGGQLSSAVASLQVPAQQLQQRVDQVTQAGKGG